MSLRGGCGGLLSRVIGDPHEPSCVVAASEAC